MCYVPCVTLPYNPMSSKILTTCASLPLITLKKYLYRYSEDAYSLPVRVYGDCCGVIDNCCFHYESYTSISG